MRNSEITYNLKRLDKLYNELVKKHKGETAELVINSILKVGLVSYLVINLRIEGHEIFLDVAKACYNIDLYANMIRENMGIFLMTGLTSPVAMRAVFEIEDMYITSSLQVKMTDLAVICLCKHALLYPENEKACINCVTKYCSQDFILKTSFAYFIDSDEIISKVLSKNNEIKEKIIAQSASRDAVKVLEKAVKYYKLSPATYVKLSLPEFLNYTKKMNLKDPEIVDKITEEICAFSRWEFLPFLFENIEMTDEVWRNIRIGFYRGHYTLPFIQTLFNLMEKHEISHNKIKSSNYKYIFCSEEVEKEIRDRGLGDLLDKETSYLSIENLGCDISNIFNEFRRQDYSLVIFYLMKNFTHVNKRFLKERNYVNELVRSNQLGWRSELVVKWIAFMQFTDEVLSELNTIDKIVLHTQAYVSMSDFVTPMVEIRCVNRICKEIASIKNKKIQCEYTDTFKTINVIYAEVMQKVKKELSLDNPEEEWKLPQNATLEEMFIDLYLYSWLNDETFTEDIFGYESLIKHLQSKNFVKIAKEVEKAREDLVPLKSVIQILKIKKVLDKNY